jgi:hypothetical protein
MPPRSGSIGELPDAAWQRMPHRDPSALPHFPFASSGRSGDGRDDKGEKYWQESRQYRQGRKTQGPSSLLHPSTRKPRVPGTPVSHAGDRARSLHGRRDDEVLGVRGDDAAITKVGGLKPTTYKTRTARLKTYRENSLMPHGRGCHTGIPPLYLTSPSQAQGRSGGGRDDKGEKYWQESRQYRQGRKTQGPSSLLPPQHAKTARAGDPGFARW